MERQTCFEKNQVCRFPVLPAGVYFYPTAPFFIPVKTLRLFFNKYLWAAAAFCIWMMFFDQNDWTGQRQSRARLRELEENTRYMNAEIASLDSQREALQSDPKALERFAREKYRMKRDGEDLYVIEGNEKGKK